MARAARVEVAEATLFASKRGPGYFGSKRFDRLNSERIHMHTISGLLHIDHRIPSLDYQTILKATLWLTKDIRQCEKQFRAAVFNILSHNRDDHAKNFSFLLHDGKWRVSPAYDLTFSTGPNGEHCSMIMGEGSQPTFTHLIKLAEVVSISKHRATEIIDEVKSAIAQWTHFATTAGVSPTSQQRINKAIQQVNKRL